MSGLYTVVFAACAASVSRRTHFSRIPEHTASAPRPTAVQGISTRIRP